MSTHPAFRIENIPIVGGGGLVFAAVLVAIVWIGMGAPQALLTGCVLGGAVFAPVYHILDH